MPSILAIISSFCRLHFSPVLYRIVCFPGSTPFTWKSRRMNSLTWSSRNHFGSIFLRLNNSTFPIHHWKASVELYSLFQPFLLSSGIIFVSLMSKISAIHLCAQNFRRISLSFSVGNVFQSPFHIHTHCFWCTQAFGSDDSAWIS